MYYHVRKPGVYLIEDIELNYMSDKDKDSPDNFMKYMKNKIDELNVRRTMNRKISQTYPFKDNEVRFNNSTNSISFYDERGCFRKTRNAKEIRTD